MTAPRALRRAAGAACVLALAGCVRDLDPYLGEHRSVAGGEPSAAPGAMRRHGCVSCHTIPGVRGADSRVGPPLAGWSRRRFIAGRVPNEPDELVRWILHPQGVKPGTAMPDMGVSDQEARDIAAYLFTLR